VRSLAAEGHEIAAHGFSHEDVSGLERNEELRRIARATEILADVAGGKPAGWFSLPRQGDRYAVGAVSPNTIDLLLEARLRLSATDWPTTSRIIGSATSRAAARCRRCPITTTSTTSSS
jgi:peptidoglycan/xylan/chitin deacetylase (PgdA/CDA1 family)